MEGIRYDLHVSNLKNDWRQPRFQGAFRMNRDDENLRLVEEIHLESLETENVEKLSAKNPLVKVSLALSSNGAEYTLGTEKTKSRMKYPHLFSEPVPSSKVAT
ncbi:hypothetical protein Tco_1564358 [Tanacetum coccineum]